jgi:hypothetical protein
MIASSELGGFGDMFLGQAVALDPDDLPEDELEDEGEAAL